MANDHPDRTIDWADATAHRLLLSAGTAYGVIFGLGLALMAWGRDALLLASSNAHLAGVKLILGLPVALLICALAGRLTAHVSKVALSVGAWTVAGILLSILAGHIPFEGRNLFVWVVEPPLRGVSVFPYGDSAAARTGLLMVIGGGVGAAAGLLCQLAVEWAWNVASSRSRLSWRSWAVLFVSMPLVLVFTWAIDDLINRPLRTPLRTTSRLVRFVQVGAEEEAEALELNYTTIDNHRPRLTDTYLLHLAAYDLQTLGRGHVDILFDNRFALRCLTLENRVGYCRPIAETYRDWMADLIDAGRRDERPWENESTQLVVDEAVVRGLQSWSDRLGERYTVTQESQYGGVILMGAEFETGAQINCRFRGVSPTRVDACHMAPPSTSP